MSEFESKLQFVQENGKRRREDIDKHDHQMSNLDVQNLKKKILSFLPYVYQYRTTATVQNEYDLLASVSYNATRQNLEGEKNPRFRGRTNEIVSRRRRFKIATKKNFTK